MYFASKFMSIHDVDALTVTVLFQLHASSQLARR